MKNRCLGLLVLAAAMSAPALGQGYYQNDQSSFRVVTTVTAGKVELEDLEGDDNIYSLAVALDFEGKPYEVELRYSNVSQTYTQSSYVDDVLVDQLKVDGGIDNWGIAGKLDLSWNCREACAYVMAGYNLGQLSADATYNDEKVGSYSTDANYMHWGAGFRYDFSPHLRASIEYLSYNIGKQELDDLDGYELGEMDFGKATAWQAGIGYRF